MTDLFAPPADPPTELGRYRVMAKTAAIRISPLQLGAMSIGESWSGFMGSMNKEQSFKLLDAYYEAGGTTIDTANNYQNEESETWIGEWMKERKNRDNLVLMTKYTLPYNSYREGKQHAVNHAGNHKRSMHMSVRDSLKKLGTDYIDVLYLHVWDHTTSIEEIMDSLHNLVVSGQVLYLGISDTPAWVVAACNTYAQSHGKTPFSIYQGRWNVMNRDMEREIVPMCQHFGMAIAPWDALGGGRLQSKKAMEERAKNNESFRDMSAMGQPKEQTEAEVKMSAALYEVAQEHGIESVTAVALAYVISKAPRVYPIIGGRKVEHLKDNIQALKIKLTQEQIDKLESVLPFDVGFPSNFNGPNPNDTGKASGLVLNAAPMAFHVREKSILHQ